MYFDDFKVTYTKSPVVQMDEYYPFGLAFNSYSRENGISQDFKYNGKENQDELGLGWLDYGARMYMGEIARWGVVDPLSEKMKRHSPYNYGFDNPLRFIDPDGMAPFNQVINSKGDIVYDDKNNDGNVFQLTDDRAKVDPNNLEKNAVQLVKENVFVGSDTQLNEYISTQAGKIGADFGEIKVTQNADGRNAFSTNMGSVSMKDGKVIAQPLKEENKGLTVNNKPGSKNEALGNVNNLRSTLEHEDKHQTQIAKPTSFNSFKEYTNWKEHDASTKQINGKNFSQTTPEYKKKVYDYRDAHKPK